MIGLEILFQEDPRSSLPCVECGTTEEGIRWVMMLQVGEPQDASPFDYALCDLCYKLSEWGQDGDKT